MQGNLKLSKPIFISLIMILSTTLVPGCLDGSSGDEETGVNATAPATPKEAMGMWLPTIDGHIGQQSGTLYGEWMDSYRQDIELTDQDGNLASAKLMVKTVDHSISLAMTSNDFDVSPAKILVHLNDRTLISQVEGNPALSYMSMDCELIDCEIMAPVSPATNGRSISRLDSLVPIAPVNSIASTYTFMTKNLVTEATALNFFIDSTQANLSVEIMVDGKKWIYEQAFNFDWILPLIYPTTDVSIERIEVTQAIQTANNDVRLVEGKDTLVRVFIDSGDLTTVDVKVTLQYCILVFCVKSIEKIHTAVQNPQRGNYLDSANFQLPADWVTHPGIDDPIPIGLFAKVEHISPDGEIAYLDTNTANDKLFHVAWFNATHDLNVHYVPLTVNGSTTTDLKADNSLARLETMFPTTHNFVKIDTLFFPTDSDYLSSEFNSQGIELLNILMIYSEYTGNIPYPDQLVLLHPHDVSLMYNATKSICGSSTPEWSGGESGHEIHSFVTISSTISGCIKKSTIAHEVVHNLGPLGGTYVETWPWINCTSGVVDVNDNGVYDPGIDECEEEEHGTNSETITWGVGNGTWAGHIGPECKAKADDLVWYEENGLDMTIEDLGWTANSDSTETNEESLISPDIRELMGYCTSEDINDEYRRWISIYRWNHLFDLFSDWEVGNPTGRSDQGKVRFVSIGVEDEGNAKLRYTYTSNQSKFYPESRDNDIEGERFEVRTFSENSRLIDSVSVRKSDQETHAMHEGLHAEQENILLMFKEEIPISEIQLIHIDSNGNETLVDAFLDNAKTPEIAISDIPNEIQSRHKEVTIEWQLTEEQEMPDVMYQLEYSWGYDLWLPIGSPSRNKSFTMDFGDMPGSDQAAFRVKAMNGMKTDYATTNTFVLPYQNPTSNLTFSENLHDGKINYGEAFDFEIKFTDPDWAAPNLNSCKARLANEQGIVVWGEGSQTSNRLITKNVPTESYDHHDGCQSIIGHSEVGISFPNNQILIAELLPGKYKLEVEYTDEHGGVVTEKFEFVIEVGPKQTVEYREKLLENYRKDLVQPGDEIPDMGMIELRYVVTLQMIDSIDLGTRDLTPAQLGDLMQIPESRRDELIKLGNPDNMDKPDKD